MKKLFLLITMILIFNITNVHAEIETFERLESNNYGVNKKINITDKNINNVMNAPYVDASNKIYDFAEIISDDDEIILKQKIDNFIATTNMDMVILTIDMTYISDSENEEYAADFYDYNDFGIDFKNYSGVLILRNANVYDPYFNIYTFGEAQLYFTYERLEDTLDYIYSDLRNHNYLDGFSSFIDKMDYYYSAGIPYSYKNYYIDDMGFLKKKYTPPVLFALIVSFVVTIIVMSVLKKKNKMVRLANNASTYLDGKSINFTENTDKLINTYTTSRYISTSSSSSGGSHHSSSSGSSGRGHSSGGGRHG